MMFMVCIMFFCYTQFDAGTLFVNMITFILYFANDKCIKDKYIS